ncbi:MAG TPA: hypothetical protein VJ750_12505 [Rhizomicrobium sp.]|nr:hypothetical protein [Rhizomicrobium sp.]
MGKTKWRAGIEIPPEKPSFLRRFRIPIAVAAVFTTALSVFIYLYVNADIPYGDGRSDYQRALADCMEDHMRHATSDSAATAAASSCVQNTPGGQYSAEGQ